MTDQPLLFDFDAETGIARLTFNRPAVLNAMNIDMARAIAAAVDRLHGMQGLRCVVIGGAGRAFMAGGDVASFADPATAEAIVRGLLAEVSPALAKLRLVDAPVLAVVQGVAAGAGLSLALAADIVLASETARFMLAYDRIGAIPDCGGSWHLPRRIGAGRAAQLMMLSRELTAAEALDWGLVDRLAPAEGHADAASQLAAQLARGPSRAFAAYRRLADAAFATPYARHLDNEGTSFLANMATEDFREGTAAFAAKRAPQFTGR